MHCHKPWRPPRQHATASSVKRAADPNVAHATLARASSTRRVPHCTTIPAQQRSTRAESCAQTCWLQTLSGRSGEAPACMHAEAHASGLVCVERPMTPAPCVCALHVPQAARCQRRRLERAPIGTCVGRVVRPWLQAWGTETMTVSCVQSRMTTAHCLVCCGTGRQCHAPLAC